MEQFTCTFFVYKYNKFEYLPELRSDWCCSPPVGNGNCNTFSIPIQVPAKEKKNLFKIKMNLVHVIDRIYYKLIFSVLFAFISRPNILCPVTIYHLMCPSLTCSLRFGWTDTCQPQKKIPMTKKRLIAHM